MVGAQAKRTAAAPAAKTASPIAKGTGLANLPSVILSPRPGQSSDLQGCVVDIVRDAAGAWLGSTRTDELLVVSSGRVAA